MPPACPQIAAVWRHQARNVAGHRVDLEVHAIARAPLAPGGHLQRVRDHQAVEPAPSTSLTVSDVPSSATDPLGAMKRASGGGAANVKRTLSPGRRARRSRRRHRRGRAPDGRRVRRRRFSDRSRLTRVPGAHSPAVVIASVSGAASTSKVTPTPRGRMDTTVRQTPAGDRGTDRDAAGRVHAVDADALDAAALGDGRHRPTSVTMPVNIRPSGRSGAACRRRRPRSPRADSAGCARWRTAPCRRAPHAVGADHHRRADDHRLVDQIAGDQRLRDSAPPSAKTRT